VSERRRRSGDGGAVAIELVIIFPMMLLLIALVAAYGRLGLVNGNFDSGVRDATRAATQARDSTDAQAVAEEALIEALAGVSKPCLDSLEVDPIPVFEPGRAVTVTARCSYPLSDLAVGMPGSVTVEAEFSSPLDPNRGVR
jgi:hypothetical protein